jgi:hypothetical protein
VKSLACRRPPYYNAAPAQWLYDYMYSVGENPPRNLFDPTEFEIALAYHVQSQRGGCSCATMPSPVKRSFWEALMAVVHRVLEKVRRIGVTTPHHDI